MQHLINPFLAEQIDIIFLTKKFLGQVYWGIIYINLYFYNI